MTGRGKSSGPSGSEHGRGVDDSAIVVSPTGGDKSRPPLPTFLKQKPESDASGNRSLPERATGRPRTAGTVRRAGVIQKVGSEEGLRQTRSEGGTFKGEMRQRALSLPRRAFKVNASSDSSSQPSPSTPADVVHENPLARIVDGDCPNFRDSIISTTSSSLYPASTVTETRTESSFPYTLDSASERHAGQRSPEIVSSENLDFDADDVSYRLRLLVNNSYFLPPAHAKPSPLSLAPPDASMSKKPANKGSNSTFLDFFRIGWSKSKPTTPITSPPAIDYAHGPILRTTSDSTTASGFIQRPHARSLPQTPLHTVPPPNVTSRVVVVRERMDDLAAAAQEAEKDLRRATARNTRSRSSSRGRDSEVDIVDPTDAVDLPPPPPGSYPFTTQASAAYGLGILESVGAAVLAEQLPPGSPGIWSSTTENSSWRQALLREAVSHSLSGSADISFATTSTDRSALPSPTSPMPLSVSTSGPSGPSDDPESPQMYTLGQPILKDLTIVTDMAEEPPTPTQAQVPLTGNSVSSASSKSTVEARRSGWPMPNSPPRAESPTHSHALAPAPRKRLVNPLYSLSQPDLSDPSEREQPDAPRTTRPSLQALRKVMSSPVLSDVPDAGAASERHVLSLSPPPTAISPRLSAESPGLMQDLRATTSFSSYRSLMSQSQSHHLRDTVVQDDDDDDDDDDMSYVTPADTDVDSPDQPRPSVTLSLLPDARPSLSISDYSNPSPTASAFHDAIFGSSYRPPSVMSRRSFMADPSRSTLDLSFPPSATPVPPVPSRVLTLSPPPRMSSSASPTALPPPPRVPGTRPVYRPSLSSRASTDPGRPSFAATVYSMQGDPIDDAEVPPLPSRLADRRGKSSSRLSLCIPTDFMGPSIHSAPAPASPTEFFDRIESTMDELDDLEDSDSDEDETSVPPAPSLRGAPARADSIDTLGGSPRPSFMRMGNHSSPSLAPPSSSSRDDPQHIDISQRKPVSNVPVKPRRTYFSSRKKGLANTDIPLLPFTGLAAAHGQAESGPSGSGPRSHSSGRRRPATAGEADAKFKRSQRESLQKFDGMLLRHLEAERSRIKQITSNVSTGSRS